MGNDRMKALRRLQAAKFALHDAALYLDSHPTCAEGLRYFRAKRELVDTLTAAYEKEYGTLTAAASCAEDRWDWVCTAFPWERGES